jgi:hypothetical protein
MNRLPVPFIPFEYAREEYEYNGYGYLDTIKYYTTQGSLRGTVRITYDGQGRPVSRTMTEQD